MQKRILAIIGLLATLITLVAYSPVAHAEVNPKCSADIQNQQREVDERRDLDGDGLIGLKPTSGFVDDNGCPITIEEYEELREEAEKGIFEEQPVLSVAAVLGVAGLVIWLIRRKRR